MSLFEGLNTNPQVDDGGDVIGGAGALDSGLYNMICDMAYGEMTDSGAIMVHMSFQDAEKRQLKIRECVRSGSSKGGSQFYVKDGKQHYLPGFLTVRNICLLACGKELGSIATEKRTIKVYDFEQKKEVPQEKDVMIELLGKPITLGVVKEIVNKKEKVGNEYKTLPETKEENSVSKVFRASDGLTVQEIKAGVTTPEFRDKWIARYKDAVIDKTENKTGKSTGALPPKSAPETNPLPFKQGTPPAQNSQENQAPAGNPFGQAQESQPQQAQTATVNSTEELFAPVQQAS